MGKTGWEGLTKGLETMGHGSYYGFSYESFLKEANNDSCSIYRMLHIPSLRNLFPSNHSKIVCFFTRVLL